MGLRDRWANSSPLTRFTIVWVIPAAGAILTAIANLPKLSEAYAAWDAAGLPTVALTSFVRQQVQPIQVGLGQTTAQIKDLQLDIAIGKREAYDNERAKWQLEYTKAQDDNTRSLAMQQIQRLDRTNDAINEQIRALRDSRGPQ